MDATSSSHTMVSIGLESRASIATTARPLTSSFLPKCTPLWRAQLIDRPPIRLSFHGVAASTKQKKKGRNSSSARDWSYEHLMVLWDEVFEQCCTDSVKAAKIRDLSYRGLLKHGRGCVLYFQEVQTRPRGSGTGFTSKPPKSSRRVPDFVTLDWYAVYLPREFLLDPRKAPNEAETAPQDDETSSADSAKVPGTCKESNGDAARMVKRHHEDVIVDVEAVIRSAQDVYQFGSDDDDDSDNADELDSHADDVNLNNDSVLILEDKEDASAASSTAELSLNPNEQDYDMATAASVPSDVNEGPLVIFDDDVHGVTTSITAEIQSSKEISAGNTYLDSANVQTEPNCGPEDGAVEIAHNTSIEIKEDHSEYDVVDDTHSGKERPKMQFNRAGEATASLSASGLDDRTCGKDGGANGAHSASGFNEACNYTEELLEEIDAPSLKGSTVNVNESMDGEGLEDQGDGQSEDDLELATQQMLFTTMRGVDRTRLMSLTSNFDFEAKTFRFGRKTAMIDTKTMDAGGEDPYNPKEDELVLLLHLVSDGRPTYGADVVIAYKDETQSVGPHEKDVWKLKAKYKV